MNTTGQKELKAQSLGERNSREVTTVANRKVGCNPRKVADLNIFLETLDSPPGLAIGVD